MFNDSVFSYKNKLKVIFNRAQLNLCSASCVYSCVISLLISPLITLIAPTQAMAEQASQPTAYQPLKLLENKNVDGQQSTYGGGHEGWAYYNYIVTPEGEVSDIVLLANSGRERFVKSGVRFIENLVYTPPAINGKRVVGQNTLFYRYDFQGNGVSENSVAPGFARLYDETMQKLRGKQLEEAGETLQELLEDQTKNISEHALAGWLKSIYYFYKQDFPRYHQAAWIAVKLSRHLPPEFVSKAYVNLFDVQLHFGHFKEAQETLRNMGSDDKVKFTGQALEDMAQRLIAQIEQAKVVQGYFLDNEAWAINVLPRVFTLETVEGKLSSAALRCAGLHQRDSDKIPVKYTQASRHHDCTLVLKGAPQTQVRLVYQ